MARDWNDKYMNESSVGDKDLAAVSQKGRQAQLKDLERQHRMERGDYSGMFGDYNSADNEARRKLDLKYENGSQTTNRGDELF